MSQDLMKAHIEINNLINAVIKQDITLFKSLSNLSKNAIHIISKRKANNTFDYMVNSFNKNEYHKAAKHATKLQRMTTTFANDFPFEIGDKVAVIRYDRGWHDGDLHATIVSRSQNSQGIWSYQAEEIFENNSQYHLFEINHTRDAFRI